MDSGERKAAKIKEEEIELRKKRQTEKTKA
jgi:hypothetical protein